MAVNYPETRLLGLLMRDGEPSNPCTGRILFLKQSILIISDDILLTKIARPMFEDLGFAVKTFEQSTEGIAVVSDTSSPIFLLIISQREFRQMPLVLSEPFAKTNEQKTCRF